MMFPQLPHKIKLTLSDHDVSAAPAQNSPVPEHTPQEIYLANPPLL